MIKKMIILFIALAVAIWIGVRISVDPGYVLISYSVWTLEMPLWLFVVAGLLTIIVSYYCLSALHGLRAAGSHYRRWRLQKRLELTLKYLQKGMKALAIEDLPMAEKWLSKATKNHAMAGVSYFLLAELAEQQNQPEKVQEYLLIAQQFSPNENVALSLHTARSKVNSEASQAIADIQALRRHHPKNPTLLRFLLPRYQEVGQWATYLECLPTAKKLGVVSKTEFPELQRQAVIALMQQHHDNGRWHAMQTCWNELPRSLHHDTSVLRLYAHALNAIGESDKAEKLIKREIKREFNPELVATYAELDGLDKAHMLALTEKWVAKHGDDATLLFVCGQLCREQHLWGKARDYLERALEQRIDAEICEALGFVLEQFKENRAAMDIYRQGLIIQRKVD